MLSHGDSHLLLWVLQKHITKRHFPHCGIHGGNRAEGITLLPLTEMENLDTERKSPNHTQPVAEPGIISISGALAQYFTPLAVFPFSFNFSFDFVDCVLGLWVGGRTKRDGMGWDSNWTPASYHVVALCMVSEPWEKGTHQDHSHSPAQRSAPLAAAGENPAASGLGTVREEGRGRRPSSLVV